MTDENDEKETKISKFKGTMPDACWEGRMTSVRAPFSAFPQGLGHRLDSGFATDPHELGHTLCSSETKGGLQKHCFCFADLGDWRMFSL